MEENIKSQVGMVKEHLQKYGYITSWDAIELYGATRLSAIIYILRHKQGYDIETEKVKGKNRYGNISNYANYILRGINDKTN